MLRKAVGNARDVGSGKLALNWEGPYRGIAITGVGAYYLEDMEERPLPRPMEYLKFKEILPLVVVNITIVVNITVWDVYKLLCK